MGATALPDHAAANLPPMTIRLHASILLLVPALIFVVPTSWQPLLWWCPWYWIYLGLVRSFAGDTALPAAGHWPGHPLWLVALVPVALCAAAVVGLARRYARRAG